MKNFHTHTYLCKHAVGVPMDYAKVACETGFSALGFSDHCPYFDDMWLDMHMALDEVPLYRKMVEEARAAYDIPIYYGFECEWHKKYKSWYEEELLGKYEADYLIFGPHWVDIDGEFVYIPDVTEPKNLIRYVDLTIEGMASGLFAYLAHPDLFLYNISEITPFYLDLAKKIIDAAVELKMPIEINGNGSTHKTIIRGGKEGYRYPERQFWELAKERGAHIVIASDSHNPTNLLETIKFAESFAKRLGIDYDKDFMPKFH
ncbi:MAG: histidinol-phosphatase [Treponemataceae bacterium]